MGAASGLLGAIFVEINRHTFQIRKKLVTKNWQKILEVAMIAAGTSLSFFCLVYIFSRCEKFQPGSNFTAYHSTVCERSEFSPMSTLLFNSQSG